ncbi:MAG: 4-alpha-glucanotransferase [Acidobacteriota bacterium]
MNLPNGLKARRSGILLHPTSLPGGTGIGDFGSEAYRFIDSLSETGQSLWQVLPLGPTGYGDSPYQSFSAFAGNPVLISLEALANDGWLTPRDLERSPRFSARRVEYGPVIEFKNRMLWKAFDNFRVGASPGEKEELEQFIRGSRSWLEPYAFFRSIKDHHSGKSWIDWDVHLRAREAVALHFWGENHAREIEAHQFFQFIFFRQWVRLARYANERGIQIIGDVPIFVAFDSADVWSHPELFHLDEHGRPTKVAGVPPDYFSETGQLWGNPIYRWDVMANDGYAWWIERIKAALQLVDIIRLDHFRGFEAYWAVPAGETTAVRGKWEKGPGAHLFEAIRNSLGDLPIIAEDLGFITEGVHQLRDHLGFPGMRILQFAFGRDPEAENFRPYNFPQDCVVYTGTHDNDTTVGWFNSVGAGDSTRSAREVDEERRFVLNYLGTDGTEINWDLTRLALGSVARTAIVPLQDVLGLGSEARMNVPARESGNWAWRYTAKELTAARRRRLAELTETYGRNPRRFESKPAIESGAGAKMEAKKSNR